MKILNFICKETDEFVSSSFVMYIIKIYIAYIVFSFLKIILYDWKSLKNYLQIIKNMIKF